MKHFSKFSFSKSMLAVLVAGLMCASAMSVRAQVYNNYESVGAGTVFGSVAWIPNNGTASNPTVTAAKAYEGANSVALDFNTGAAGGSNLVEMIVWNDIITPPSNVTDFSVAVCAPAGTVFRVRFDSSPYEAGVTYDTPLFTQTTDNDWQVFQVKLTEFTPALTEAFRQGLRDASKNFGNIILDIMGDGSGGPADLAGTFYMDDLRFSDTGDAGTLVIDRQGYEAYGVGTTLGDAGGIWVSDQGSITSPVVTDAQAYEGAHSVAVDFNVGPASGWQIVQTIIWEAGMDFPEIVTHMQFAVRAPKGTVYKLMIDKTPWDGSNYASPMVAQNHDNDWDLVTIPLTAFTPALDAATIASLRSAGAQMSNFYFQILGNCDDPLLSGNPGISGTLYLDAIRFMEEPGLEADFTNHMNYEGRAVGVMGQAAWSDGEATMTVPMVTLADSFDGLKSITFDFNSGSETAATNAVGDWLWMPLMDYPIGTSYYQFAVKAPAGTVFNIVLTKDPWQDPQFQSPAQTQVLDNAWQFYSIPMASFDPALDASMLQALNDNTIKSSNVMVQIYGAGSGGNAGISGSMSMDSFKFSAGSACDLNVDANTLVFTNQDINAGASPAQTVTISNGGTDSILFKGSALSISGADAADFVITGSPDTSAAIAPAGTLAVQVTFDPSTLGPKSAFLNISSNDPDEALVQIVLSGDAVPVEVAAFVIE